jgi:hypothetical protein
MTRAVACEDDNQSYQTQELFRKDSLLFAVFYNFHTLSGIFDEIFEV